MNSEEEQKRLDAALKDKNIRWAMGLLVVSAFGYVFATTLGEELSGIWVGKSVFNEIGGNVAEVAMTGWFGLLVVMGVVLLLDIVTFVWSRKFVQKKRRAIRWLVVGSAMQVISLVIPNVGLLVMLISMIVSLAFATQEMREG